jgi:hypothetical protein
MLSRGGMSQNPKRRMYLMIAAVSGLVASTAGIFKEYVETLNF